MQQKIQKLKNILAEIADLKGSIALLEWDQQTYMPKGGAEARARQLGTLGRLQHEMSTSSEFGRLLDDLRNILQEHSELSNVISINKLQGNRSNVVARQSR